MTTFFEYFAMLIRQISDTIILGLKNYGLVKYKEKGTCKMKKLIVSLIVLLLMGGAFSSVAFGSHPAEPAPTSVEAEE
jgi:hypothetical protein